MAAGVDMAFEHPFGVGRHAHVVGDAFDHRQRRLAQQRNEPKVVHRQPHHRRQMVDRMRADHEADRHRLAGGCARFVDRAQVARRVEVDAGFLAPAQHQPADADIGPAGLRVDDEIGRGRDIGRAVDSHAADGQAGDVRSASSPVSTTSCAGASALRDFEDLRLVAQPPLDFPQQLARRDAEGARDPRPAAGDAADQLLPLRPDGAEQDGARIAFECLRDIGKIDRLCARFELVASREAPRRIGAAENDRDRRSVARASWRRSCR